MTGQAAFSSSDERSRVLCKEHTDLLFAHLKSALVANILVAGVTAAALGLNQGHTGIWLSSHVLLTVFRLVLAQQYHRAQPGPDNLRPWLTTYAVAAVLTGLTWGLLPFTQPNIHESNSGLFMGVVLAGVSAGAFGSMSAIRLMYAVYAATLLGTFACWSAFFASPTQPEISVLSLVFFATLMVAAKRYNAQLVKAFDLGHRNQDLLDKLRSDHAELRTAQNMILREQQVASHVMESIIDPHVCAQSGVRHYQRSLQNFVGDVVLLDKVGDRCVRILLGDATGHGLSAALAAIPVAQTFSTMNQKNLPLSSLLDELNRNLHRLLPTGMFMAAAVIEISALDGERCRARIWNGGLENLLIVGGSGEVVELPSDNLALGILAPKDCSTRFVDLTLEADDRVYVYTDGITEAVDATGIPFGRARLANAARLARHDANSFDEVMSIFNNFISDTPIGDDITLLEIHAGQLAKNLGIDPALATTNGTKATARDANG